MIDRARISAMRSYPSMIKTTAAPTSKIGQYEILERIAVGGMAEVFRGRALGEEGFEKTVAIKRILPTFAQDARFVSMLVTEARIHAQLSHRNIVQIQDLGVSEAGEYFIVLEYVEGRDLAALLAALPKAAERDGPARLPDAVALHVISELAEGVHFAHEVRGADGQPLGLVHRDISPSNALLSYAGEVKLSDFGLAKRRTDHSVVGSLKGKLAYMSPEQARRHRLDRRSDIFALGAVLFEMCTGRRLREIADELGGWQEVASGLVPRARAIRPDLPEPLEALLAQTLTPDPRDRLPDARSFVARARAALEKVERPLAGEGVALQEILRAALPPGSPAPPSAPSQVIRLVSEILPLDPTVRTRIPMPPPADEPRPTRRVVRPAPGLTPPVPRPVVLTEKPRPSAVADVAIPTGPRAEPGGLPPAPAQLDRPPRRATRPGFLLLALVVVGLSYLIIHPTWVPDLLAYPVRFDLATEPPGASVSVDGHPLPGTTPTYTMVRPDGHSHLVEIRKVGFHPVHQPIQYNRFQRLSLSVALEPRSRPSFEPLTERKPMALEVSRPPTSKEAARKRASSAFAGRGGGTQPDGGGTTDRQVRP